MVIRSEGGLEWELIEMKCQHCGWSEGISFYDISTVNIEVIYIKFHCKKCGYVQEERSKEE